MSIAEGRGPKILNYEFAETTELGLTSIYIKRRSLREFVTFPQFLNNAD